MTVQMSIQDLITLILNLFKRKQSNPRKAKQLKAKLNMATATLTWVNPTTRTDNSPLVPTDIASVNIWDVSTDNPTRHQIGSLMTDATTFSTEVLTVGFHNFTVTVVDTAGHVSADSNVASVEVKSTLADPSPATNLTAVLNA